MNKGRFTSAMSTIVVAGFLISAASPAEADVPDALSTLDAIATVAAQTDSGLTDVLADQAELDLVGGSFDGSMVDAEVSLPSGSEEAIVMQTDGYPRLEIMPKHLAAKVGTVPDREDGVVIYETPKETSTAAVAKTDGSVQVAVVIEGTSAPTEYDYEVMVDGLPAVLLLTDGAVKVETADGEYAGMIAPAWAFDVTGASIETSYEVTGHTVIQHVNHDGAVYPVVADPWFNQMIWSKVTVTSEQGQPRVNIYPAAMAKALYLGQASGISGLVAGRGIINSAGWDEVYNWPTNRTPGLSNSTLRSALKKQSMRDQFACHALGGFLDIAGGRVMNLEKFRVNRTMHWTTGVAVHRCNWQSANRY